MTKEGYKQVLLTEEVYEELKKRKGNQSFSSFIRKLLATSIMEHIEGETEVSRPTDVEKKIRELGDLIENQPLPISREYAVEPHEHLKIVERNLQNLNDWVVNVKKKFAELGLDSKKETSK